MFPGLHLLCLGGSPAFMIIAEQMENAMQQQKNQLMLKRDVRRRRILGGPFRRNHHIPEQQGLQPAAFPFLHGKGDDVGRSITLQIISIDVADPGVIKNQNRQLRFRKSRDA